MKSKYTVESLEPVVRSSVSYMEVLRKLDIFHGREQRLHQKENPGTKDRHVPLFGSQSQLRRPS